MLATLSELVDQVPPEQQSLRWGWWHVSTCMAVSADAAVGVAVW